MGLLINLTIPDLWQQEAVQALKAGADVIVNAPTGAGKTWVFELYAKAGGFGKNGKGQAVFTVPTRALANDKWAEWKASGWKVGIATGDVAENLDAPVVVATLETQRERFIEGRGPALLVVDEYQMLADESRGVNYELVLALAPPETQLLLLSGSVANPRAVADWLGRLGRTVELVQVRERPIPLDEEAIESLPRAPKKIDGFWPVLAARAMMADLGPLLIFAPQRAGAEKIARKIAAAFPEDDPIELPEGQQKTAGKELARMLRSRVAYHHSGLSYATRAGIIEPLARKGQLRVIVATMGLAAGINFSVRSVLVSDTKYRTGPFEEQLRPDELLQMFGRAGRRGLDDAGYVLAGAKFPRLMDASPRRLHRVHDIEWPTLLRVMDHAVAEGREPFEAARELLGRLFGKQTVRLGIEEDAVEGESGEGNVFNLGPKRDEMLNAAGAWEAVGEIRTARRSVGECLVRVRDRWSAAGRAPEFVKRLGKGSLCKLRREKGFVYGLESKLARRAGTDGVEALWAPLPWVRKALQLGREARFSETEIASLVAEEIVGKSEGMRVEAVVARGALLAVQCDVGGMPVEATLDASGSALIDPPLRTVAVEAESGFTEAGGRRIDPPRGTAAHAWRALGLVDANGVPTLRGQVFSRFQRGEGLMVAAALEDATYPVEELVWHLANLRAGFRFDETGGGGSERLAAVSRMLFGMVDHKGYLELGLCPGYGEGAAELLEETLVGKARPSAAVTEILSGGDIERAQVEWLSLLRHIVHAPDIEWDRWHALKAAAKGVLTRFDKLARPQDLPQLPGHILNHGVKLKLWSGAF
jgi:superfamily II DNA/RNA helicase